MVYAGGMLQRPVRWGLVVVSLLVAGAVIEGQSAPLTTTLATIEHFPTFFHGRVVSLVGTPVLVGDTWRLPRADTGDFVLIPQTASPPSRAVELRGQLFDVGRLDVDDSRLSATGIRQIVQTLYGERWPARGALFVLVGATWKDDLAETPSVRSIALHPEAYDGKPVTIRGRFHAQNLFGDLPAWPRKSQWDFVLQSADAAVWVTGLRPRGRDFDLNPRQRLGSRTWLEVAGTVRVVDTLPTIEATHVALTTAEDEPPPAPELALVLQQEPPAIVFSAPLDGDIDVDQDTPVRIQFSRDMNEASFQHGVQVTYQEPAGVAPPAFTVTYQALNRSIEIRFERRLEAGATIRVALGEGIQAADGEPLAPVTIGFKTKPTINTSRALFRPRQARLDR